MKPIRNRRGSGAWHDEEGKDGPIGSMRHEDFTIGETFWTAAGPYRCTDVGTRTIVAVHLGPRLIVQQQSVGDEHRAATLVVDDPSWLNGPPYAVAEVVFDEDDLADCCRTEANRS